jgi:hypothetical protein
MRLAMSKSGDKINYTIRPAKGIERKLIGDALLGVILGFGADRYTYIGFGSKYFVDFIFFHRHLHIEKMISIELDKENHKVYEFNNPLSCIQLKFGHSDDVLPVLEYGEPIFSWLDYDSVFNQSMLSDIDGLIRRCESGSIVVLSYNSRPYKLNQLKEKHKTSNVKGLIRKELLTNLPEEAVASDLDERGLNKWENFSKLLKGIVDKYIKAAVSEKNIGLDDPFVYKQMFYFDYKDGVEMSTVGGALVRKSQIAKIDINGSMDFSFIRSSDERCLIEVPPLTSKESRELLSCMPIKEESIKQLTKEGVFKEKAIRKFNEFYKYYPRYSEVDY